MKPVLYLLILLLPFEAFSQCEDKLTFSTFFETDPIPARNTVIFDGLLSSKGEYLSVGFYFNNNASSLILIRQDANGNPVDNALIISMGDLGEYFPFWGDNVFLKDAFIKEVYDVDGISTGFYIAATVLVTNNTDPPGIVLLKVNHNDEVEWIEHLNHVDKTNYVKGLLVDEEGNAIVMINQYEVVNENHLAVWRYNPENADCSVTVFPLDGLVPQLGALRYAPTAFTKTDGFQNADIKYAVCANFTNEEQDFICVYLLDENLDKVTSFIYDLQPEVDNESIISTSIVQQVDNIIVSGYSEIPGGVPVSFVLALSPVDVNGQLSGTVEWAKEFFDDQSVFFG